MMPSKKLRLDEIRDVGEAVSQQRGRDAVDRRRRLAKNQGQLTVAGDGQPGQGVQEALA